jgi:hypothetical protein
MQVSIRTAIIAASGSVIAVAFTRFTGLVSDFLERRRHRVMHLKSLRNELVVNGAFAEAVLQDNRTLGIRFADRVWTTCDASVIYRRNVPSNAILEIYSSVQLFNTLNEWRLLIARESEGYRAGQIEEEHAEMLAHATRIKKLIAKVLKTI